MALKKSQKSLKKWTKQDWGTKSGKPSTQGKKATGERYLPKKAREALSDKEYAATSRKKRADTKKGKQHPKHPTKKAVVAVRDGEKIKIIRFGDQKMGHNYSKEARKSFKARHAKNIAKGPTSAAYWANKTFWSGPSGSKKSPPKSQKQKFGKK